MKHYSPGSSELYDDDFLDAPTYTSTSSNQWGVWSPSQDDAPPSYSSVNNNNNATFDNENIFGSLDDVPVTPLWVNDDDPPSKTSSSRSRSRYSSSPKLEDDFPIWLGSTVDPLWTPSSNKNNSSRNYSPPFTPPRSSSPNSDEDEINCPKCTFFIRPNKTVCEMCGASITRPEPKKSYKRPSKPKTTISTYRDLYEEDDDEVEEDKDIDDILNPFEDPPPRRNNQSSYSSSDNYRNPSSSKSRNKSSRSSYLDFEDSSYSQSRNKSSRSSNLDFEDSSYSQSRNQSSRSSYLDFEDSSYSQSRNQSSSRNRTSYQTPTPPSDGLWIEDDDFVESVPSRRPSRQKQPPKPYTPPSFIRDAPRRPMQKPPTPPLKEKQITCSACNFDNHFSMTHCEICYTQLSKTPEPNNRNTRPNRIEETMAKRACTACSFYNDVDRIQCEMCYSPIEAVRRTIISHDPDKIQCPTCTFMNHKSMAQCEMCHNPLPGSNIQQQVQEYQQFVDNLPGPTTKMFQLPVDDHDYMTTQ